MALAFWADEGGSGMARRVAAIIVFLALIGHILPSMFRREQVPSWVANAEDEAWLARL